MGENDQVAAASAVRGGLAQLSPTSTLEVIPGSAHAFFGRYGPQAGDGIPSVDRASAEQAIIERVVAYLGERR